MEENLFNNVCICAAYFKMAMIHFRKFEVVEGRGGLVLYHRVLEKTIFNQACMPNPLIASHHVHEDVINDFGEQAWAWLKGTGWCSFLYPW